MKPFRFLFSSFFLAFVASCTTSDSTVLKEARSMQQSMMQECQGLDSLVSSKITSIEGTLTEMTEDTTLNADTAKMATYISLKEKYNALLDAKTRIDNWRVDMKLLPTPEEIAKGAENPFGKEASDEDVLRTMKSSNASLLTLKSELDELIK